MLVGRVVVGGHFTIDICFATAIVVYFTFVGGGKREEAAGGWPIDGAIPLHNNITAIGCPTPIMIRSYSWKCQ